MSFFQRVSELSHKPHVASDFEIPLKELHTQPKVDNQTIRSSESPTAQEASSKGPIDRSVSDRKQACQIAKTIKQFFIDVGQNIGKTLFEAHKSIAKTLTSAGKKIDNFFTEISAKEDPKTARLAQAKLEMNESKKTAQAEFQRDMSKEELDKIKLSVKEEFENYQNIYHNDPLIRPSQKDLKFVYEPLLEAKIALESLKYEETTKEKYNEIAFEFITCRENFTSAVSNLRSTAKVDFKSKVSEKAFEGVKNEVKEELQACQSVYNDPRFKEHLEHVYPFVVEAAEAVQNLKYGDTSIREYNHCAEKYNASYKLFLKVAQETAHNLGLM